MRRSVSVASHGGAQLNVGHPLLAGLVGFINGSVNSLPMDMITRKLMTRVGVNAPGSSSVSQVATGANGIFSARNEAAFANWRPTTTPLTLMMYVTCGTSIASMYIGGSVGNSGTDGFQFQLTNGDGTIKFVSFIGGSAKSVLSAAGAWSNGKSLLLTLVLDGTNLIGYVNGLPIGSVAASGTIGYDASFGRVQLLGSPDFTGTTGSGHWLGLLNRAMQPAEIKSISQDPMLVFSPLVDFVGGQDVAGSISIIRPSSDVTTTGWTGNPDNTNKYNNIDEITASDTDYITSPTISGGEFTIFGLTGSLAAGSWDIRYRANFVGASAQVRITLLDGSNVSQGASGWQTVTSTFADYTATVATTGAATRVKIEVQ